MCSMFMRENTFRLALFPQYHASMTHERNTLAETDAEFVHDDEKANKKTCHQTSELQYKQGKRM